MPRRRDVPTFDHHAGEYPFAFQEFRDPVSGRIAQLAVPVGIRSKALDLTKGISQRLLVQVRIGL